MLNSKKKENHPVMTEINKVISFRMIILFIFLLLGTTNIGLPSVKSAVGIDPNPLSRQFTDAGKIRQPLSSSCEERKIISVINGWGDLKNACTALRAFSNIRHQLPDVTYHLYGVDFQAGGVAAQWAKLQGLSDGVVFHGPVSHEILLAALINSTLMLHPSRSESCPMGIAEALAVGLPVVGGEKSSGVPWMVGKAGVLVDTTKPGDISDAIVMLLTSDEIYLKMSDAAKERVKEFDPGKIADSYEAEYMSILDRNKKFLSCR